jgi:pyruvate,water dikinase
MLLSRKIVENTIPQTFLRLEPHDSFYIGTDVYYTYIVQNDCWKLRLSQKSEEEYFSASKMLKIKILDGIFPDAIKEQFRRMLEYYGQSPIIVRSSSLLEDSFENAFAGKYESVFCVNNGSLDERLAEFENAVKAVYASTMDESALEYRLQRGVSKSDEQMAILVQRVSGLKFENVFMPCAAGVGYSYNSYRWHKDIESNAGMIRVVMGLGTRAVDRTDGDYPRIASLDKPQLTPLTNTVSKNRYSQHKVDVLDLEKNIFLSINLQEASPMVQTDNG